jgi:cell volume regulation protein A
VGLRGAVPIILATFPHLAGISHSGKIFHIVFFVVLTSSFLQGWTLPWVAKLLGIYIPAQERKNSPIEFSYPENTNMKMVTYKVPDNPLFHRKSLVEIPVLKGSLVVTVFRNGQYFVPSGGTLLEVGDELQILTEKNRIQEIKMFFNL